MNRLNIPAGIELNVRIAQFCGVVLVVNFTAANGDFFKGVQHLVNGFHHDIQRQHAGATRKKKINLVVVVFCCPLGSLALLLQAKQPNQTHTTLHISLSLFCYCLVLFFIRYTSTTTLDLKFVLAGILQTSVGAFMITDLFLLMMQSSTVIGLCLNFAALHFVQDIDDVCFVVASMGLLGPTMQQQVERKSCASLRAHCLFWS